MVRQRAVLGGVQIASLLGLEELRPDGHGRPVPPQPPHDIAGTRSEVAGLDDLYRVITAHGRGLDILVANAGGGSLATLEEMTPASFEETFLGYVRGIVFAVQKALPLLNAAASVVVTGSTATTRATKAFGAYSAAKAALRQFVRCGLWNLPTEGSASTPSTRDRSRQRHSRSRHPTRPMCNACSTPR